MSYRVYALRQLQMAAAEEAAGRTDFAYLHECAAFLALKFEVVPNMEFISDRIMDPTNTLMRDGVIRNAFEKWRSAQVIEG